MNEERVRQATVEAFKQVAGREIADIDPCKDLRQQIHLDSMQFVALLARLEVELGVELPVEAIEASTLDEFLKVVGQCVARARAS